METEIRNDLPRDINLNTHQLSPELHWMWVFVFTIGTMGLYPHFWLYLRIRELGVLSGNKYKPVLWFFVPAVPLAMPFAFTRLLRAVQVLEGNNRLSFYDWVWVFCQIVASLALYGFSISEADLPYIEYLFFQAIYLIPIAALYSYLHVRLGRIKSRLDLDTRDESHFRIFGRWVFLIVIVILAYVGFENTIWSEKTRSLDDGNFFVSENNQYRFPIRGQGWYQVEIGTYSDGSAEYEFKGPYMDNYLVIFDHGPGDSVQTTAYWRIGNNVDTSLIESRCLQEHSLTDDASTLEANISCQSSFLGLKELVISKITFFNNRTYEIFGRFSPASNLVFIKNHNDFREMIAGFGEVK